MNVAMKPDCSEGVVERVFGWSCFTFCNLQMVGNSMLAGHCEV